MGTKGISLSIAFEYLRSKTKGATSFVSSLAYTCVAIGVAVLIIVSSVMNGFEKELQRSHTKCYSSCFYFRRVTSF
jgi:ABC-type lipoprotein release transport system permease subunit